MIEQNAKIGELITIKWYRTLWKGILMKDKNPNKVLQPRTSTPLKKGTAEKAKTGNVKTEKAVKVKKGNVKTGKAKIGNVKTIKTKTGNVKTGKAKKGNAKTGKAIEKEKKSNEKNSGKGKLVAAATVSPRTDFIVTEKEQQSPRSVIQSFRNRSSPRRLFHLPEDSGESSNDDVFDEDDEESDVDAYPTENAFESNLNTYNTENVSEEKEESTVGCVSSASNELKEDDDYVCSAENEFDDDEDYVNSDENEFEEDDNYVNLSENEFEEDDSRERQSASHSSDNDIIQDYSSVIQVVTSKAKWKLMGTKGPAALARALANVILTTEELQSASLTGKRDPRGKKRKVQESKLELIKVGSSTEHEEHLKFLFEGSDDFCVIPSFGVIPAFSSMSIASNVPGLDVDPTKILHGEQYLEIYKPFPARGATLKSYARIADVLDKGSGAVIIANVETFDEQNEKVCFNQFSTFVVGAGKFGGKRTSTEAKPTMNPPQRQPDASITEQTGRDQAALYRLSGDRNPLHIDPSFAAMGGFAEPILHGLCSFGYATRHVLKQYCDNDVTKIKAIKVRFSRPVLPGQNIRTDMWKDGNRVYFQCKVVDNGYVSLSGAYIDLHGSTDSGPSAGPAVTSLMSDGLFEGMAKRAESQPALAKKINAVFAFEITKDGKTAAKWTADMKTGAGVYRGDPKGAKADCTLIIDDKNMVDMASGKLNGQQAFMKGLLKIKGNMMLAQKLGDLLKDNSKM